MKFKLFFVIIEQKKVNDYFVWSFKNVKKLFYKLKEKIFSTRTNLKTIFDMHVEL